MKKILLLLLCFITACLPAGRGVSVLDDSKCELPCWQNIMPGETSQDEALQIIYALEGVDQESIVGPNQPWEIFSGIIHFSLFLDSQEKEFPTDGVVYITKDKVTALLLTRNLGLTFGGMITRLGEPENIISIPFNGSNPVFMAINPSRGIGYEHYAQSDEDLQPSTKIDAVMFFDPASYEDLLEIGMFSTGPYGASDTKRIMYPWKGYGSIEELYPPRFP